MKSRLLWMLGSAVVGASLLCFSPSAIAQQSKAGPNVGQQGEFNGEHVDTGAAAMDTGPETAMEPAEGLEAPALKKGTLKVKALPSTIPGKVQPIESTQDLNIEQTFDLQEIMGPDVIAEMR
ncbi:MAG: hypothetical protein ACRD18_02810 [Terriglobia bacterium]